jgi:hypothetical protein
VDKGGGDHFHERAMKDAMRSVIEVIDMCNMRVTLEPWDD